MPVMKVLLLAATILVSYARAKHLLIETADTDEVLADDDDDTLAEVLGEEAVEAVKAVVDYAEEGKKVADKVVMKRH